MLYLLRATFYCAMCTALFAYLEQHGTIQTLLEKSSAFHFFFWGTHALIQGSLLTGIWVVGHECGHGAFSESATMNDTVGFVTHTLLLVPFFAWQFTHGK